MRKLGSLLVVLSLGLFMVGCSGEETKTPATPAAGGAAEGGAGGAETPTTPAAGSDTATDAGGSTDAGS